MTVVLLLFVLLLLLLEGFFSGSEMAVVSCDRIKLRQRAAEGSSGAQQVHRLLERPERLLATTLVGTNFCVVTNAAIVTLLCLEFLGRGREGYATLILTPLVLLVGEMVPKAYFRQHADQLAPLLGPPLAFFHRLFSPLIGVVSLVPNGVLRLLRVPDAERDPYVTREELQYLVHEGGDPGPLETEERKMIYRIFRFGDTTVEKAMIPLIDVVALPREMQVRDAIALVSEHHISRIPVFEGRIDHIVGIIHAFDLLGVEMDTPIEPFLRPAHYVPETKPIDDLLKEMQQSRTQMAIVVDEYGGVVGIVTIEDLLEEVVGEIADEYDEEPPPIKRLNDGSYLVDARVEIERLTTELNLAVPEGEYETLGGFLLQLLQKIPESGEEVTFRGATFLVTEADKRSITKVKIRLSDHQPPASSV